MNTHHLTEEVGDPAVRDICNECVKEESPGHWVHERLLHLINLEMFVADTLLVDLDTRHGQNPVFFLQPAGVELTVRNDPQEDHTQGHCEQPRK